MLRMLQAHGLDAGPTQRPLLAGAIAGVIATVPALCVLTVFQALDAPARAIGASVFAAALAYAGLMLFGGILYGWLFQRAANDPRGGWLFGMAFGFVLWMLGPVPVLQWLPDQPILRGDPAAGLLLAELLWGLAVGLVFPLVHRHLHVSLENRSRLASLCAGPEAAAQTQVLRALPPSGRQSH
jgi:Na+/proline symporter